jgi:hypothetical protein
VDNKNKQTNKNKNITKISQKLPQYYTGLLYKAIGRIPRSTFILKKIHAEQMPS